MMLSIRQFDMVSHVSVYWSCKEDWSSSDNSNWKKQEVVNLYSLQDVPTIVYILLLRPSVIVTKEEGKIVWSLYQNINTEEFEF